MKYALCDAAARRLVRWRFRSYHITDAISGRGSFRSYEACLLLLLTPVLLDVEHSQKRSGRNVWRL